MSDPTKNQPGQASPYRVADPNPPAPGFNPQVPPQRPVLQLTPEEIAVFKECRRESFWFRCVPLGLLSATGVQLIAWRGWVQPHPRYGLLIKYVGAAFLAFITGKISYRNKCREKIMQLPNSPLAEAFRSGKSGREAFQNIAARMALPSQGATGTEPVGQTSINKSDDYSSSLDHDTDSNIQAKGLDDINRPSVDRDLERPRDNSTQPIFTSYEELRKRNREEYDNKLANIRANLSSQPTNSVTPLSRATPSSGYSSIPTYDRDQIFTPAKAKKNQYGDNIEE